MGESREPGLPFLSAAATGKHREGGYEVRSSDMAEVAQTLEQLETVMEGKP